MVTTFEGNVSIRLGDRIFITPTGKCKGTLRPSMIVETDLQGNKVRGALAPSSELLLHLELYRLRPDITCVVHTHAPYATAFAVAGRPIETNSYFEAALLLGNVPLCAYGRAGTPDICRDLGLYTPERDALLLSNHGLVTYHAQPDQAFYLTTAAENIAKVLLLARQLGGEKELPPQELQALQELRRQRRQASL
jgi:L-fuculose-phosphate aldolase